MTIVLSYVYCLARSFRCVNTKYAIEKLSPYPANPGNHGGGAHTRVPHSGRHQLRHPHPQHRERGGNTEAKNIKTIVNF